MRYMQHLWDCGFERFVGLGVESWGGNAFGEQHGRARLAATAAPQPSDDLNPSFRDSIVYTSN